MRLPPPQPACGPPARAGDHGPARTTLLPSRPCVRDQPPPAACLSHPLLRTRQRAPPASRGGTAGNPPPHDTRALPDSRGVPRGVGGAQCVRRGARPFRGACPRPRVPCRQLSAHCGRRDRRTQWWDQGMDRREPPAAQRKVQDDYAIQGTCQAPPPGDGDPGPDSDVGRVRRTAAESDCDGKPLLRGGE